MKILLARVGGRLSLLSEYNDPTAADSAVTQESLNSQPDEKLLNVLECL